jgi:hypothetical protein
MIIKEKFMTQTAQSRFWAYINKAGKDITADKPETDDNINLFISVIDSLNKLYGVLSRLNFIIDRKIIEKYISLDSEGEME